MPFGRQREARCRSVLLQGMLCVLFVFLFPPFERSCAGIDGETRSTNPCPPLKARAFWILLPTVRAFLRRDGWRNPQHATDASVRLYAEEGVREDSVRRCAQRRPPI